VTATLRDGHIAHDSLATREGLGQAVRKPLARQLAAAFIDGRGRFAPIPGSRWRRSILCQLGPARPSARTPLDGSGWAGHMSIGQTARSYRSGAL
jgi:hypothetical protein